MVENTKAAYLGLDGLQQTCDVVLGLGIRFLASITTNASKINELIPDHRSSVVGEKKPQ